MSWDATTPADSEVASQGASRIRELKTDITTALTAEGSFPVSASAPKFYPKLNKDTTGNRPAASSDYPGRMFFNSTTGTLQRVKTDGSGWEDVYVNPATQSVHQIVQQSVASVVGVVTLNENGNSYLVTGTEAITSFTGWSAGVAIVQWASARIITHAAGLYLKNALSRNVVANDISVFEFASAGNVREIGFYGAGDGCVIGQVVEFAGATPPAGFLECNGASLLRASYPGLYAVIGTAHGTVDGTHFNLPDMRGKFARGYDHGAGNDPDAAARTGTTGGATGDNVGSIQADGFASHTHVVQTGGSHSVGSGGSASPDAPATSGATGGNETRPKNVGLMFCIKI